MSTRPKLIRAARWGIINGLFAFIAWRGIIGSEAAEKCFVWILWILVTIGFLGLCNDSTVKEHQAMGRPVPLWLDVLYDVVLIAGLAWFGWYWSAIGVFIMMATGQMVYEKEIK